MERNLHMHPGGLGGVSPSPSAKQLTNRNWPDSFGFGLWGSGPCFVVSVEKGSIAHKAGILPGDQLLEIDGHDVANMSMEAVKTLARHSPTVPPTVGVVTRLQYIEVVPTRQLGYGFTVHGTKPVTVQSVNPFGPGYQAGLREGDLVLQVNGHYVRTSEAVQTLIASHYGKMVLGVLAFESVVGGDNQLGVPANEIRMRSPGSRVKKARDLFGKMNELLGNDYEKKMAVVGVLKQYAEDRQIERLSRALALLLNSPQHRRLVGEVRPFIPVKHRHTFDSILDNDPNATDYSSNEQTASLNFKSRSRVPDLSQGETRCVIVDRGTGSFGFILRGSNPVYIESVDINGAADRAGLRAGHCILKLNGLDVRKCGHAHLVKLLQGSGNRPTFEVMQMVDRDGIPIRPGSAASSDASSSGYDENASWMKETSRIVDKEGRTFKQRADHLLTKKEKDSLRRAMTRYNNTRDVAAFYDDISRVFDTPSKTTLWMFLIPKLTAEHKDYCLKRINVPRELLLEETRVLGTSDLQSSEIEYSLLSHYPWDVYPLDQRARLRQASKNAGKSEEVEQPETREYLSPQMHRPGSSQNIDHMSISSSAGSEMSWIADVREMNHVGSFKQQLEYLLTSRERLELKNALQIYTTNRNVDNLIEDASVILDTPSKRTLWLYLIPLLPDAHQEKCRGILSIPVNLVNPGNASTGNSYTSDSEHNQSISEYSSGDDNNAAIVSANPQKGDVMFQSEDDFNFIGKAASLLKNNTGQRLSLASSDDLSIYSHNHQYSPYGARYWRSTPSLAFVDQPDAAPLHQQNQNRSLTLPSTTRVNGHDERIGSSSDNWSEPSHVDANFLMLNRDGPDLPHPVRNYRVRELEENDPRLREILPPEALDSDAKVFIMQTNIPSQAYPDQSSLYHQAPSPRHSQPGTPVNSSTMSSPSHAYSLQSSPHQSPQNVQSNRSPRDYFQSHPVPVHSNPPHIVHSSPPHIVHSPVQPVHNHPIYSHSNGPHIIQSPTHPGPEGHTQAHPHGSDSHSPQPHGQNGSHDLCLQCGANIEPGNRGPPVTEEDARKILQSQDSFKEKAMDAIQALDDVVAAEMTDEESNESQKSATRSNVPLPPPPPPLPPVPPPLPKLSNKPEQKDYPMYVKRLNWEKIDVSDMQETVWGQLGDQQYLHDVVKYLELEHKFSTKRTDNFIAAKATRLNRNQVSILNSKKAYNTSILLGHLKMSVSDLKNALYRMDEEIFTPELIQQMLAYAPNEEENEKYAQYNGLFEDLSKPDQFGYEMSRMPGYLQKLKAMLFKANFAEKVDELKETLNCIKRASQELLNSKKLKKMIEMVLAMGNYMNKGNSRIGEASAFKITYLSQLDTTKTTDGKSTFLHVLSKAVLKTHPEITTFRDELPSISDASKVTSDSIAQELSELKKVLLDISNSVNKYKAFNAVIKDRFQEVMGHFINIASDEIQGLYAMQTLTIAEFHTMLKYFGEDPTSSTANDIFKIFSDFVSKLERAHQENLRHDRH